MKNGSRRTSFPPRRPEKAFARFAGYIDHLHGVPGVHFITASQLPAIYPDRLRTDGATEADVLELARRITAADSKGIDFQIIGSKAFSPADQFAILCGGIDFRLPHSATMPSEMPPIHVPPLLLGPDGEPPAEVVRSAPLDWYAFRDAVRNATDFVRARRRIPARVFIGPDPVRPTDFLVAMAAAWLHWHDAHRFPQTVALGSNVKLLTADHVVPDGPNVYGGWIVHREGYRAARLLEIARLQAWTLKPTMP